MELETVKFLLYLNLPFFEIEKLKKKKTTTSNNKNFSPKEPVEGRDFPEFPNSRICCPFKENVFLKNLYLYKLLRYCIIYTDCIQIFNFRQFDTLRKMIPEHKSSLCQLWPPWVHVLHLVYV